MIQFDAAQLSAVDQARERAWRARLAALVLDIRPDLRGRATPEQIGALVDWAVEEGGTLQLRTEFELAVFLAATLLLGRDWHQPGRHALAVVIQRAEVPAHLRAQQLLFELERSVPSAA